MLQALCTASGVLGAVRATRGRPPGRPQATDRQAAGRAVRTPSQAVVDTCMHQAESEYTHWNGVADKGSYGGKAGAPLRESAM